MKVRVILRSRQDSFFVLALAVEKMLRRGREISEAQECGFVVQAARSFTEYVSAGARFVLRFEGIEIAKSRCGDAHVMVEELSEECH